MTQSRHTAWIVIFSVLVLTSMPTFAASEPIDGFRDLKFGMTKTSVQSLEFCATSDECLYELAGKNRYFAIEYTPDHAADGAPQGLSRITIDMGAFTNAWYGELQNRLLDQYRLTRDVTPEDIAAFEGNEASELVSRFEHGQVLLKVVRRPFGNLILKVIYQAEDPEARSMNPAQSAP